MNSKKDMPTVLLVQPPVYDFALYDLYFKPYGLLRIGRWFSQAGYNVVLNNGLDYRDKTTVRRLGAVHRNKDGTGKFHKQSVPVDSPLPGTRDKEELEKGPSFEEFRKDFGRRTGRYINRYGVLEESFRARMEAQKPDIVLVTSQMTYWYPGVKEAVDLVRELFPRVPVVVGGVYASLLSEHCRRTTGAELVLRGDERKPLEDLLRGANLPVPAGKVPSSPLLLPGLWENAGVLRLNRGCPFRCSYCASKVLEPSFHPGSVDEMVETLVEMNRRFGTRDFAFYDDALLVQKEQVFLPFLERIISRGFDFSFYLPNAVHLRYLDEETASLMRRAGFEEVRLGYESAEEEFGSPVSKYEKEEVGPVVEGLRRAGFAPEKILLYVLAGLPGQRAKDVEHSLREASRFAVRMQIAEYSPVPYTDLWKRSVGESPYPLAQEPLFQNNTIFPMEWEEFTDEDMRSLKRWARELSP